MSEYQHDRAISCRHQHIYQCLHIHIKFNYRPSTAYTRIAPKPEGLLSTIALVNPSHSTSASPWASSLKTLRSQHPIISIGYGFKHRTPNLHGPGGELDEYDEDMPMPELYMDNKCMPALHVFLDSNIISPGQLAHLRIPTPRLT